MSTLLPNYGSSRLPTILWGLSLAETFQRHRDLERSVHQDSNPGHLHFTLAFGKVNYKCHADTDDQEYIEIRANIIVHTCS